MSHNITSSPNSGKSSPRKGNKKFYFDPPPEAPVFTPTLEEFKDPLQYIKKIRPIGEKTGICKIIPPAGWKSPFALDMNTMRFVPRIQRINELEARTRIKLNFNDKLTKFFALGGKTFQIPIMEKTALDLYTLHRKIKELGGLEIVNKEKKWNDVAFSMGYTGKCAPYTLKCHYENLIHPFLQSQAKNNEEESVDENKENFSKSGSGVTIDSETGEGTRSNSRPLSGVKHHAAMRELKSLRFLGPGPKMAVCDGDSLQVGQRTRGKKIMYEFDPLAKYMCKGCKKGDVEEAHLVMCCTCDDRYHNSCLIPPLDIENAPENWRCPKCVAAEGYKPLEEFGFAQAEREYTLNEFKQMADAFKSNYFSSDPSHSDVEQEFWRVVSSIDEAVTVEYGADLHVTDHGSAFPRTNQPCVDGVDIKKFEKYAKSPWNLNNLPVLEDSVLRHISADISGMKIPWMYAGMCFATFCWHNEDHWSYSINYLHLGEAKTWYGVPGSYAQQFEAAMQEAVPELFESQPDLLHQLVTIMNPNDIMTAGVPVYRTNQMRGEFVITFPRAYHAGFNQGFNFAEACNFAPADWLVIGRECIAHYSQLRRNCVFSHDELICKMALIFESLDRDVGIVLVKDMSLMVEAERLRRIRALTLGVGNAAHVEFDKLPDDERQCYICNTTVFLSAVACSCDYTRLVCLDHITQLCTCDPKNYVMKYQLKLDILQNLLVVVSSKLCGFEKWTTRVQDALNNNRSGNKISLRNLTELLVEAKEKEFPQRELVELLEYHVRRCIECSALAKALVANCNKQDNPSKITVEDLELFHEEIEKLPCSIAEEPAVREILGNAHRFEHAAQNVLNMQKVTEANLVQFNKLIELGQSLNLELPDLHELEKKVMEFEWIRQVDFAIKSGADFEIASKLEEEGKSFPNSHIVTETKKSLEQYIQNNIPKENSMPMIIGSPSKVPSLRKIQTGKIVINECIDRVLKGQVVLYLQDLESLIIKAKLENPPSPQLPALEQGIIVARNWEMTAKALFLKKNDTMPLMEALWPRKFVSRHLYYSKQIVNQSDGLESLINNKDDLHYTRKHFIDGIKDEFHTLSALRVDNIARMDTEDFGNVRCLCGNSMDKTAIVCELCLTPMHYKCFRETDSTKHAKTSSAVWDTNFRLRRICGYCKRTNRPLMSQVEKLASTIRHLKLKIPECLALQYTWARVEKWRKDVKKLIDSEILSARSNEILAFFRLFHGKRYSNDPSSDELMAESRLVVGNVKEISKYTLLSLKEELIHGNRLEITPPELNEIWNILNPLWIHAEIESGIHNGLCYPLRGESSCGNPIPMLLSHSSSPKKTVRRGSLGGTPESMIPAKRKKRKHSKKQKQQNHLIPQTSSTTEEHEPETACAAATCKQPGDESLKWVACDGACKQWYHMKCVDLDEKNFREEDEYHCPSCAACNRVFEQVVNAGLH